MQLSQLSNTDRSYKRTKRVGRGPGSKRGKTSTRGHKGDKSRSGYKRRYGKEGGQLPLFQKLPCRGFTRGRFKVPIFSINLRLINVLYADGEVVNAETLNQKGFNLRKAKGGIKILGEGGLSKKVVIEAHALTKGAIAKLEKNHIEFKILKHKIAEKQK